jgi:hypothetical protein
VNPFKACTRRSSSYLRRSLEAGCLLTLALLSVCATSAHADALTGNYRVYHNDSTDENIRYQCNSMDAYLNGGGSLSGVLECNSFKFTANGHTVMAFSGKVENVEATLINGGSTVLLVHVEVENLHVVDAYGGGHGYFAVKKSATIDMVNAARIFIRASRKSTTPPTVRVVNLGPNSEVYWCGVNIHADHMLGGKMIEDCSWPE